MPRQKRSSPGSEKTLFFIITRKVFILQEKFSYVLAKIQPSLLCSLPCQQIPLLFAELLCDNMAYFLTLYHLPHFFEACPLHRIRFSRQKANFLNGRLPLQAIKIIVGIAVDTGRKQLELIFLSPDARFLKQLPDNRLPAGLPCLGRSAGIFPGTGKGLAGCPPGQQQVSLAVIYPNTHHQAVLPYPPPGAAQMLPAGTVTVQERVEGEYVPKEYRITFDVRGRQ